MSSARISVVPGNRVRCTVTFVPELGGTINLADVSATCYDQANRELYELDVVAEGDNVFHADVEVPDDVPVGGTWRFRFESNPPGPKISKEGDDMAFDVESSRTPTP